MAIDFEKDQEDLLNRTENIDKLADKIKQLEGMQHELEIREDALKEHKKQIIAPILHKQIKKRRLTGFVKMD